MQPEPEPEAIAPKNAPTPLQGWVHAGGCADPACADPACQSANPAAAPASAAGATGKQGAAADADAAARVALAASRLEQGLPPVCRHWWRKGACLYGEACRFGHPPHDTLPPWPRRAYRQQTYNAGRVGIFRRWLVETFGLDRLQSDGVLDVAGGHGKIAFELLNVHGIPSTVIDPRPLKLQRCTKMWAQGLWHKTTSVVHADEDPPVRGKDEPALMPRHLRLFLEEPLWRRGDPEAAPAADGGEQQSEQLRLFAQNLWRSSHCEWGSQGLSDAGHGEEDENTAASAAVTAEEAAAAAEAEAKGAAGLHPKYVAKECAKACEALSSVSVAIGMHPDQAAGPLVEFAVERGLPFAVVPCCVYSAEFPKRKLKDGTRVRSYENLCDYLQEQSPDIERVVIPGLEGRNVCLFRRPGNEV